MPIDYTRLTLNSDFVLLAAETTVKEAYHALIADSAIEQHRYTYLLIPAYPGFVVVRWNEIELIALLSGQNITSLAILDLPRLLVAPGYTPDATLVPAKSEGQNLADLLRVLQPVSVVDQQLITTQEATHVRDQHPGRRLVVRADRAIKGVLAVELLGAKGAFESIIKRLLRSSGAVLGPENTTPAHPSAPILASPPPAPASTWQPYRVEAAMPETSQVGRETEVWVKLSLPKGTSLADELPAYTRAGDKVGQESLTQNTADFEIGADKMIVYVEIEAPHFTLANPQRVIQVRRGLASATTKILLLPNAVGKNCLVNLLFYQDVTTKAAIATLTLTTSIAPADPAEQAAATTVLSIQRSQVVPVAGQTQASSITQVFLVNGDYIAGDQVGGDKITVGNISNASGIAIGAGSQVSAR